MPTRTLTHPDLPGQPITVDEISVPRHKARGWVDSADVKPATEPPAEPVKPEPTNWLNLEKEN
jgi:hypothetical protein